MKRVIDDLNKLQKTKTEIEILKVLEEILENTQDVNVTYEKMPHKEHFWRVYINGEYFYEISTPIVKILEIVSAASKFAYIRGSMDAVNQIRKAIKK